MAQALGMDIKQYNQAIDLVTKLSKALGAENLVITGHSLGGGLASASSLATGIKAETFNAAGLNSSTAKQHKLDMKKAETLITT